MCNESSGVVLDKILNLKTFIQSSVPQSKVIIFNIINRAVNGKVSLTVENLNNYLNSLKLNIVDNSTIGKECLGKKGFHLTKRGAGKLAINFIHRIRSLCCLTDSFHAPGLASSITVSPNNPVTSIPQISQFKEQSENQNLGNGTDKSLRHLNLKKVNRSVIGHLNINSLRSKYDSLKLLVKNVLDVCMISETKLDAAFLEVQFLMDGFTPPYRMGRNTNGGGIALYVR